MTLEVFTCSWFIVGCLATIILIIIGQSFLKTLKIHEIITVLGTIVTAWPFILIYIALHQSFEGNK